MGNSRDDLEVFTEARRFLKHVFVSHTLFQAGKPELQAYIFFLICILSN